MATRNDITGDALVNIPKRGPKEGKRQEFKIEMHMNALKTLTADKVSPHHKNRWISEQRAASIA